jgi:hypothetical protein
MATASDDDDHSSERSDQPAHGRHGNHRAHSSERKPSGAAWSKKSTDGPSPASKFGAPPSELRKD